MTWLCLFVVDLWSSLGKRFPIFPNLPCEKRDSQATPSSVDAPTEALVLSFNKARPSLVLKLCRSLPSLIATHVKSPNEQLVRLAPFALVDCRLLLKLPTDSDSPPCLTQLHNQVRTLRQLIALLAHLR